MLTGWDRPVGLVLVWVAYKHTQLCNSTTLSERKVVEPRSWTRVKGGIGKAKRADSIRQRKMYSSKFKAKVALPAIQWKAAGVELARRFGKPDSFNTD